MTDIVQVKAHQISQYAPFLAEILIASVNKGASVGFCTPLEQATAEQYWNELQPELEAGSLMLWLAVAQQQILGTVQLSLCMKENGRHRAELQKLIVHPMARRQGIGSDLIRYAENYALREKRSLMVLDTEQQSDAWFLYRKQGYQESGHIPDYAVSPGGQLHTTTIFYKHLQA